MARDIEAIRKVLQTVPPKVTKGTVDADVEALGAEICMLVDSGHTAKDIAILLVQAGFGAGQQTLVQAVRKLLKGGTKTSGATKSAPKRQKRAALASAAQTERNTAVDKAEGVSKPSGVVTHEGVAVEPTRDEKVKPSGRQSTEF